MGADRLRRHRPPLEPAGEALVRSAGAGYFAAAAAAAAADGADLPAIAGAVRAATGRKGAELYMPLRVALTGRAHGPELAPLLQGDARRSGARAAGALRMIRIHNSLSGAEGRAAGPSLRGSCACTSAG